MGEQRWTQRRFQRQGKRSSNVELTGHLYNSLKKANSKSERHIYMLAIQTCNTRRPLTTTPKGHPSDRGNLPSYDRVSQIRCSGSQRRSGGSAAELVNGVNFAREVKDGDERRNEPEHRQGRVGGTGRHGTSTKSPPWNGSEEKAARALGTGTQTTGRHGCSFGARLRGHLFGALVLGQRKPRGACGGVEMQHIDLSPFPTRCSTDAFFPFPLPALDHERF